MKNTEKQSEMIFKNKTRGTHASRKQKNDLKLFLRINKEKNSRVKAHNLEMPVY